MAALEAARFLSKADHEAAGRPLARQEAERLGTW
jgi:hypothetical protein